MKKIIINITALTVYGTAGEKGCEGKKKDQRNWPFGGVVATIVEPKNPKNQIFCWAFLKKTREIQINITRRFLKLHDLKKNTKTSVWKLSLYD